jgi:hypothetical protein
MSTASHDPRRHPVAEAVARLHAELDAIAGAPVWTLDEDGAEELLVAVTELEARVAELTLRVAGQADRLDVGARHGATSTASWWAHACRLTRAEAHRRIRLAKRLAEHERVAETLAAGAIVEDQAGVILDALDALPDDLVDVDLAVIARARTHLLAEAAHHDAKGLRVLGRRVLDVVAPQVGEEHERRVLEAEEADARAACRFSMVDDGHGTTYGRFTLPTFQAEMLRKHLLARAAPKHAGHTPAGVERRPSPERLGAAFAEYVESWPVDSLPDAGGIPASVVVTVSLDSLISGLGSARLDTGAVISAGEARRLACRAGIIPAVLDGQSQVLDLGRTKRFHSKAQRVAMAVRDGGCTADGCDWPPGLCHAHHDVPWSRGGTTTLAEGRLLCPRHHARAHDPTYTMTKLPEGKVAFHRRT